MVEEEYPIHPTLDKLIQAFKKFSGVGFPRGMPQPAAVWKPILQDLTKFEAVLIPQVSDYLCGKLINLEGLSCPENLRQGMSSFKVTSSADSEFLGKLVDYRNQIENLFFLLQDCVSELGNPCRKFRV